MEDDKSSAGDFIEDASDATHHQCRENFKCHRCEICGKHFNKKSSLTCHMRLHTGEKPYQCTECDTRFTHKSTLLHHTRLHTGEKPYSCDICGKRFRQRSNYTLHKKVHTNEKYYVCKDCGKQFAQKVHLTTHMRLHTGEKPYRCEECSQSFFQRSHLTRHIKKHSEKEKGQISDKTDVSELQDKVSSVHISQSVHKSKDNISKRRIVLECEVCKKKFNKKSHLRNHIFIHTGEKPFTCPKCGKKFSEKSSVTRHLKIHMAKKCEFDIFDDRQEPNLVLNSEKIDTLPLESNITVDPNLTCSDNRSVSSENNNGMDVLHSDLHSYNSPEDIRVKKVLPTEDSNLSFKEEVEIFQEELDI